VEGVRTSKSKAVLLSFIMTSASFITSRVNSKPAHSAAPYSM